MRPGGAALAEQDRPNAELAPAWARESASESESAHAERTGDLAPWAQEPSQVLNERPGRPHPRVMPSTRAVSPAAESWSERDVAAEDHQPREQRPRAGNARTLKRPTTTKSQGHRSTRRRAEEGSKEWQRFQSGSKGARSPREAARQNLPGAPSPYTQRDETSGTQISRDKVALACDRFTERAQNGQRVLLGSSVRAPDNRGVGDVLTE